MVLADRPDGTARQSELAAITDFSLSRLSHAITRLVGKGWVTRNPDPRDRRVALVRLTDAGADALTRIAPNHVAAARELFFARLTSQQVDQLREARRAILAGLPDAPSIPRWP